MVALNLIKNDVGDRNSQKNQTWKCALEKNDEFGMLDVVYISSGFTATAPDAYSKLSIILDNCHPQQR